MFRRSLDINEGLLLVQPRDSRLDSSIHMFAVFMNLCVIWINSDWKIVDKVLAKAWYPIYIPKKPAMYVLEIHPDHFDNYAIGDHLDHKDN